MAAKKFRDIVALEESAARLSKSLDVADARLAIYLKYDPDQPRDEKGRFASTGAAGFGGGGGRILTRANSPTWWPTMSRDLLIVGAAATVVGIAPVVRMGFRGFSRTVLRGLGPVAVRISQRYGANFVGVFQQLARQAGFKVPRSAMKGIPRRYAVRAWDKLPPGARKIIDRRVGAIAAGLKIPKGKIKRPPKK
jgi:hypothetical protein